MEVILLEKVRNLGALGDRVAVRSGYGRNYLIPQGKAVFATEKNTAEFAVKRSELEKQAQEITAAALARAETISKVGQVIITAHASQEGKLYGSVGTADIVDALAKANISVERKEIRLPAGPLRLLGEHDIILQLHSDVTASIRVQVVPHEEKQ